MNEPSFQTNVEQARSTPVANRQTGQYPHLIPYPPDRPGPQHHPDRKTRVTSSVNLRPHIY